MVWEKNLRCVASTTEEEKKEIVPVGVLAKDLAFNSGEIVDSIVALLLGAMADLERKAKQ